MISNSKLSEVDLFFIRLKHGWVSNQKKEKLYKLVLSLENATPLQKERFILIYNLKSQQDIKYNLSSLGRKQNCSPSAVRRSICRVRTFLVNLKDEKKQIFLELIKDNDYFYTQSNE